MLEIIQRCLFISSILSKDFLAGIRESLDYDDFTIDNLATLFRILIEYYDSYSSVPSFELFIELVNAEDDIYGGLLDELNTCLYLDISETDYAYVSDKYSEHLQTKKYKDILSNASDYLQLNDLAKVRELLQSATESKGVEIVQAKKTRVSYFDSDFISNRGDIPQIEKISTGYPELDRHIGGGVARKELVFLLAPPNSLKSWGLINLSANWVEMGYVVFHVSIEMSLELMLERFDMRFLEGKINNIPDKIECLETLQEITPGELIIDAFASNSLDVAGFDAWISATITETGLQPDFIVLDYIDELRVSKSENLMAYAISEMWRKFRGLGDKYNCGMVTASSTGQSGMHKHTLTLDDFSDSMGKIRIADTAIGLCATPNEQADNLQRWICLRLRNGKKLNTSVNMRHELEIGRIYEL